MRANSCHPSPISTRSIFIRCYMVLWDSNVVSFAHSTNQTLIIFSMSREDARIPKHTGKFCRSSKAYLFLFQSVSNRTRMYHTKHVNFNRQIKQSAIRYSWKTHPGRRIFELDLQISHIQKNQCDCISQVGQNNRNQTHPRGCRKSITEMNANLFTHGVLPGLWGS